MEILLDTNIISKVQIEKLMAEGNEILKVTSSARKTITEKNKN